MFLDNLGLFKPAGDEVQVAVKPASGVTAEGWAFSLDRDPPAARPR
jgi:hypothetical protein